MLRRLRPSREDARAALRLAGWREDDILGIIPYDAIEQRIRQANNTRFRLSDDAETPTPFFEAKQP